VSKYVSSLLQDWRRVMLPYTAAKLRVQRTNTLKDFVHVSGQLGVTHFAILSQTNKNVMLRLARSPHGPTLTFRVDGYTLASQVRAAQDRPAEMPLAFEASPLVVLHGFGGAVGAGAGGGGVSHGDAMRMTSTLLQNMFPQIQPATVKLSTCRRVLLAHYHKETGQVELRHYYIRNEPVGLSSMVKTLVTGGGGVSAVAGMGLGKLGDISEAVLGAGAGSAAAAAATSGSDDDGSDGSDDDDEEDGSEDDDEEEEEDDDGTAAVRASATAAAAATAAAGDDGLAVHVTLPGGGARGQKSAVKLTEIGPRLTLTLVKIEQGLCEGDVLYHAFVTKTAAEAAALKAAAAAKAALKEERRKEQEANVARKKAAKAAKKSAKEERKAARQAAAVEAAASGGGDGGAAVDDGDDEDGDDDDDDGDDDEEEEEDAPARRGRSRATEVEDDGDDGGDDDDDGDDDEDDDGDDDGEEEEEEGGEYDFGGDDDGDEAADSGDEEAPAGSARAAAAGSKRARPAAGGAGASAAVEDDGKAAAPAPKKTKGMGMHGRLLADMQAKLAEAQRAHAAGKRGGGR